MKLTPTLYSKGIFQLKNPYIASPTNIYTCVAIRSFGDIYESGIDVYTEYYKPLDIDVSTFNIDKNNDVAIITIVSEDDEFIYVPNSFILAMPDMSSINYHHLVVSIDFGAIPEYLDTDYLEDELADVAGKVVGKLPNVITHIAETTGIITPEQHQVLEANRLAAIELKVTAYAKYQEQLRLTTSLLERITQYEQLLIENNIIT
jgi:hypothetical protein